MIKLKVIQGTKKKEIDYELLFLDAFMRTLGKVVEQALPLREADLDTRKKLVFFGVKMINLRDYEVREFKYLEQDLELISLLHALISTLTPREFETIFPVSKEYNGKRWGMKDYFSTKTYIRELGIDKTINGDIRKFLWEYHNWELVEFSSRLMSAASILRKAEGKKGIMEEWCQEHNLPTYTMSNDQKGRTLTNDQTGQISKVKKQTPRFLKIIK